MKHYFFIFLAIIFANAGFSQEKSGESGVLESPKFVIKTNTLYWLTTTPNLGFETVAGTKLSLDVAANFNPWKSVKFRHFMIQPELRYWFNKPVQGHFVGFQAHYAYVNIGAAILDGHNKQGNIFGIGASYGYNWAISTKWRLEGVASLGYAHFNYLVYGKNGEQLGGTHYYNYVGPTKLALNLIYVIK
jgi:hypothetical protein